VADQGIASAIDEAISKGGAAKPAVAHGAGPAHEHVHHGRTSSWVAIAVIVIGFAIGGAALPAGPVWWLFWLGTGIVVVGGIMALSTRILDDWY
jgi:hypothetical protein